MLLRLKMLLKIIIIENLSVVGEDLKHLLVAQQLLCVGSLEEF